MLRKSTVAAAETGKRVFLGNEVGLSAELIQNEVEKIVASKTFRSAAAQRNFLRYAVAEALQGRAHLLKEYSIGVAVFKRAESFDPRLDSIVRTEARKLRSRLAKYFEDEGRHDQLRIDLPKGKYSPVFAPNVEALDATEGEIMPARELPSAAADCPPPPRINFEPRRVLRIAVLPFMNRGPSKADELFSDGLTDELTHAFTRVPGLEVVARTSAFQFKGQAADVREVGRKLNVHAVVEGSVRRSGKQVRILVQLDDALNGRAVWSESFDRKLADLLAVQREIAITITSELGTHFHAGRELGPVPPNYDNLIGMDFKVYAEYLRGQYFWNRHTIEDFETAIGCFQHAIAQEERYPRAYTSLAYCYVMLPILKAALPAEFMTKVRTAASKALEIDSSAGEAHIALALPHIHNYEWAAAGEEFRKGLDLCPSSAIGHAWYGTYLVNMGRGAEGLREHQRCLELDPVSASALFCHAQTLYLLRRYDESIDRFRKALALNPSFPREHAGLGLACLRKGSYVRAIAELELAQSLTHGPGRVKADLAYAYAVSGQRDKAVDILNDFLVQFTPRDFPAAMIGEIYIGLGEKDLAFEWLHRAIDQKDLAVFLKSDPLYDPLRSDLRFPALMRRMNLA